MRLRASVSAVLLIGCLDPTQATIEITTNVDCGTAEVEPGAFFECGVIGAAPDRPLPDAPNGTTRSCTPGKDDVNDVGTVVLFPDDGATRAVAVVIGSLDDVPAEACIPFARGESSPYAAQCIVARRSISFADHTDLRVPVLLDKACAGVACDGTTTCVRAGGDVTCVDSDVACRGGQCALPDDGGGGQGGGPVEVVYGGPELITHVTGFLDASGLRLLGSARATGLPVERIVEIAAGTATTVLADLPLVSEIDARQTSAGAVLAVATSMQVLLVDPATWTGIDLEVMGATDAVPIEDGITVHLVNGTNEVNFANGATPTSSGALAGTFAAVDRAPLLTVAAGNGLCFLPTGNAAECSTTPVGEPVIDVWTATGNEAFTVSAAGLVQQILRGSQEFAGARLPASGEPIVTRAIGGQPMADGDVRVWVAGEVGGVAYLAFGVAAAAPMGPISFSEIDLSAFPPAVDLWVDGRVDGRAYLVLEDGRVLGVAAPL